MKTTLDLPDDLVRRMKIRAVQERKPLKRLVADLLSRGMSGAVPALPASMKTNKNIVFNERGFPVIRCGPNAPASRMTVEELLALEQQALLEEDMQRVGIPL